MIQIHPRQTIIDSVHASLSSDDSVRALWQAGSAANGRADDWSDIDFIVVARDEAVTQAFERIEDCLQEKFGIDLCWRVPEPAWHGHSQRFYRLRDAAPHHLVDVVVQKVSATERFLETARHGTPVVCFDRDGIVQPKELDKLKWSEKVAARAKELAVTFPLFQPFVGKELRRARHVDAYNFYFQFTVRPLVEMLRIRHCPDRFDFGLRYLNHDLPAELAREIESLVYVGGPGELESKHASAVALFNKCVSGTHG